MDDKKLIELAHQAKEYAYSPYSNFKVGAALLTTDGKVFTGCNVENISYGATNCAERTAIFKAISEGHKNFEKIAIVSSGGDFTTPCGMCLQVMAEFMLDKNVVLSNDKGDVKVLKVSEFLPHSFSF